MDYDLIIIGAGTSGFPSAKIAAQFGKKVLLIGDGDLGGKCIENGCIPAKVLIYATYLNKQVQKAREFGIKVEGVEVNFQEVLDYTQKLVQDAVQDNEKQLKKFDNIEFIRKKGHCVSESSVEVDNEVYNAPNILISTGTRPWIPPIEGLEEIEYLTYESIFHITILPESIAFVGGGFISLEFANVFNTFGSKVYIVDTNSRPIFATDETVSWALKKYFEEEGITFISNSRTSKVANSSGKIKMTTNKGKTIEVDQIMISTGFVADTEALNLNAAGVKTDRKGNITVNEYLQTTKPNIFAIGDILGKTQFTHMALRESKIVINNIFNDQKIPISFDNIPYAVFTDPPIGSVGKTEQELKNAGIKYKVVQSEFKDTSRGTLMNLNRGMVKLIYNEQDQILGCHIIGEAADILIHEIVPLIHAPNGLSIFKKVIHAHPTLSELYRNLQEHIGFI